ncbi:arginase, hepatic-like [Penaeus japonicus]|uniref:arginase, hepatic-like n=1 Tax=Penaeus japonicus TaxID=27405 RepID=UPI001C715DC6|nr:arginase, hepatic-like [Penaeus japonicus]
MLRSIASRLLSRNLFSFPQLIGRGELHVGVVGAPFNKGQRRMGVKEGPSAIKDTGFLDDLRNLGVDVTDYGSVNLQQPEDNEAGPDGERWHKTVLEYNRLLADSVAQALRNTDLCLTLGGDHSIAIGTINGHSQVEPEHQVVVLWVDAHADINVGMTSPSGNMHGMPVSYHLRELAKKVNRLSDQWPQPCLSAHHISYIGLRDLDPGEVRMLKDMGIQAFWADDVERLGLSAVLRMCFEHLKPSETRPLHISFDIDALDPGEAPSTGTPVRGGLTLREGLNIVETARSTGHLRALDMVEVNPDLGNQNDANLTSQAARLVILSALAGYRGA